MILGKSEKWGGLEETAKLISRTLKIPMLDETNHWRRNAETSSVTERSIVGFEVQMKPMDQSSPRFASSCEDDKEQL